MASQSAPGVVPGSYYVYAPNEGAAIFGTVIFFLSTAYHLWQCIVLRSFKITALIPAAGLLFTVGFALRAYGAYHYDVKDPFLASTVLIYMSPPIYELANYHMLGRILYYIPYCSPIHPGRTLTTFGTLSAIVEVLNALGVSWSINPSIPDNLQTVGKNCLKASLVIQIAVILIFVCFVGWFQHLCHRSGVRVKQVDAPCMTMYVTSGLVFIRCVFRTVESFSAESAAAAADSAAISPILRFEWFFYVFEVIPMIFYTFLWNVRHPRYYLPANHHVYLAQDGKTELEGPGWTDDRAFVVTAVDPFGLCGGRKKQSKHRPFWETDGISPRSSVSHV